MQDLYLFIGKFIFWVIFMPTGVLYVLIILALIAETIVKKLKILNLIAIFYKHKDEFFEWKKNKNIN